jgi:hypothetical protein
MDSHSAAQEIPYCVWNHKSLRYLNPFYAAFLKIWFNIILPSMPRGLPRGSRGAVSPFPRLHDVAVSKAMSYFVLILECSRHSVVYCHLPYYDYIGNMGMKMQHLKCSICPYYDYIGNTGMKMQHLKCSVCHLLCVYMRSVSLLWQDSIHMCRLHSGKSVRWQQITGTFNSWCRHSGHTACPRNPLDLTWFSFFDWGVMSTVYSRSLIHTDELTERITVAFSKSHWKAEWRG